MKQIMILVVGPAVLSASLCWAQAPSPSTVSAAQPTPPPAAAAAPAPVSDVQKLAVRDAQHKRDTIEKQQANITTQLLSLQQQATAELNRLQKLHDQAQAEVDKAKSTIACAKDQNFDEESEACVATPTPAPPAANASSQPKPSPAPSPGAAAPPKVEQAKKPVPKVQAKK